MKMLVSSVLLALLGCKTQSQVSTMKLADEPEDIFLQSCLEWDEQDSARQGTVNLVMQKFSLSRTEPNSCEQAAEKLQTVDVLSFEACLRPGRCSPTEVIDLAVFSQSSELHRLFIKDFPIKSIDTLDRFEKLQALAIQYFYKDPLQSLELDSLAGLQNLESLVLAGSQVGSLEPLGRLPKLTRLDLAYAAVDLKSAPVFPALNTLILDNWHESNDASALARIDAHNFPRLQNLEFNLNSPELCQLLPGHSGLTRLSFQNNKLSKLDFLAGYPNLETLLLDTNHVTNTEFLQWTPKLKSIHLVSNEELTSVEGFRFVPAISYASLPAGKGFCAALGAKPWCLDGSVSGP